jgi:uncharacterized protein (DUF2267 family)
VEYTEFIDLVARGARIDRESAERATRATLQTLAERIDEGESRDLASELPPALGALVATSSPAERFDVHEFIRRVAERAELEPRVAERRAAVVFTALGLAVSPKELHDLLEELPTPEYSRLLPAGPLIRVMASDEFIRRVAERAGVDKDTARRATDAVLETLAERIAAGEVEDLIVRLPLELHEPLRRGEQDGGPNATPMRIDDFIKRVAQREGGHIDPLLQASEHARAVLLTLHDAVGDEEWLDVTAQLPREYDELVR